MLHLDRPRDAGVVCYVEKQRLKEGVMRMFLSCGERLQRLHALGSQTPSENREAALKQLHRKHVTESAVASADDDDTAMCTHASAVSPAPKQ